MMSVIIPDTINSDMMCFAHSLHGIKDHWYKSVCILVLYCHFCKYFWIGRKCMYTCRVMVITGLCLVLWCIVLVKRCLHDRLSALTPHKHFAGTSFLVFYTYINIYKCVKVNECCCCFFNYECQVVYWKCLFI